MDIFHIVKEKKHMFSGEYELKRTSKEDSFSFFVYLPKKQLLQKNKKPGDTIILEAYQWVDE
jgi:hypothetical protein